MDGVWSEEIDTGSCRYRLSGDSLESLINAYNQVVIRRVFSICFNTAHWPLLDYGITPPSPGRAKVERRIKGDYFITKSRLGFRVARC